LNIKFKIKEEVKMKKVYAINGLPFFSKEELLTRKYFQDMLELNVQKILKKENSAWDVTQIEGTILTPSDKINPNYTNEDVWFQESKSDEKMVLRPETTTSSYEYAKLMMEHQEVKPPFVVWQTGKSFRREVDQSSKHCRFKEFYQQEFQCFYTSDTKNDYQEAVLEPLRKLVERMVGLPARIVESDRLPSYSMRTMDIEVDNGDKWMEICSISVRTDFDKTAIFQAKKKVVEKDLLVLEIAFGLDRLVYNYYLEK
jgi:glycyl-tRNA synthetase